MSEQEKKIHDVAIIGAGGAGQMALLRSVLNHLDTIIFTGDPQTTRRSRATWVAEVDNIPGFFDKKRPISATSREVIGFIEKNDDLKKFLTLEKKIVTSITEDGEGFLLKSGDESFFARYVVLCTGTMDVQPLINDSIEPIFPYANRGDVLYCIRCDGHKTVGQDVAVIGHQAGAGWIAVMLKERYQNKKLYILTNGENFDAPDELKTLLAKYGIEIVTESIVSILGDPKKELTGFDLGTRQIHVPKAFVALGSIVYNGLAKELGVDLSSREHLITNEKGETSVPGFYAAGDLVQGKKKQVYTAWDMAVDAIDDIDLKIRTEKRAKLFT